jgi:ABC-type Fe3+ transport system substrate-binding protein
MGFNQLAEGYLIPLKSKTLSQVNPWYDICEPPSGKILVELLNK